MPERKQMSKHQKQELSATSYVSSDSARRWRSPIRVGAPYYDSDGQLVRNINLPEIEVIGSEANYVSTQQRRDPIRNAIRNFYLSLPERSDTYANAKIPFGDGYGHERDNIVRTRSLNLSRKDNGDRVRLEMMGFRNVNGKWKFPKGTKDSDGDEEYYQWCAENANKINSYYGKPTMGHAWTRHGVYGDSSIVVAPYKKSDYTFGNASWKARSMSKDQAKYVQKHIDDPGVKLLSGDIVDMRYPGSSFTNQAFAEGDPNRVNTHTGTIIVTGPNKEHTYVAHSMGSGLKVEPIGNLLGVSWTNPYITGIRRPGTKKHPFKYADK